MAHAIQHKLLISLGLVALFSCGAVLAGSSDIFDRARHAAAYDLKDPNSAQFRNVRLSVLPTIVCGEINAKNSYGAYTGFHRFRYDDEKRKAEVIYPGGTFYEHDTKLFDILCNQSRSN